MVIIIMDGMAVGVAAGVAGYMLDRVMVMDIVVVDGSRLIGALATGYLAIELAGNTLRKIPDIVLATASCSG
jgi:Glu-tRNA(Gln) amidotransferase subunit E-like FAD-binding protein